MKIIIIGNSHLDQFKPQNYFSQENILQCPGASIRGLMNNKSTTGLNKAIRESNADAFIFHLGQVDIEFGYYYKSVITDKKIDKIEFIKDTIRIYSEYLNSLSSKKIVIIGVNPTVIINPKHIFKVNFEENENNTVQETGKGNKNADYNSLLHIYNDDMIALNSFLKDMNNALKTMCKELGIVFYDLWDLIIDEDGITTKQDYIPNQLDHHLVTNSNIYDKLNDIIALI